MRLSGQSTPVKVEAAFSDWYSHSQAGQVAAKRLKINQAMRNQYSQVLFTASANLDANYSYTTDGELSSVTYPGGWPTESYTFDTMDRPMTMTEAGNGTLVTAAAYGVAGERLSISGQLADSWSYNNLFQITGSGGVGYIYPTNGTNAGRACVAVDYASGEQVQYQYDSLNRLSAATGYAGTGGGTCSPTRSANWGNSYSYDGFGNLMGKNVTAGSAPYQTLFSGTTDANGNVTVGNKCGRAVR